MLYININVQGSDSETIMLGEYFPSVFSLVAQIFDQF
jgi:hypothetical protein